LFWIQVRPYLNVRFQWLQVNLIFVATPRIGLQRDDDIATDIQECLGQMADVMKPVSAHIAFVD
jgi:hypothetical protein